MQCICEGEEMMTIFDLNFQMLNKYEYTVFAVLYYSTISHAP